MSLAVKQNENAKPKNKPINYQMRQDKTLNIR